MLSIKRASISAKMAPTWHLAFNSWGHNMASRRTRLGKMMLWNAIVMQVLEHCKVQHMELTFDDTKLPKIDL